MRLIPLLKTIALPTGLTLALGLCLAACTNTSDRQMEPVADAGQSKGDTSADKRGDTGEAVNVDVGAGLDAATDGAGVGGMDAAVASGSENVPREKSALRTYLNAGKYQAFKAEPAVHDSAGPHGKVRTFVNKALADSLAAKNAEHPLGAASVKELHSGDEINGYAVMVKTKTGTAGNSWFWYEIIGSTEVVASNTATLCSGCHSKGQDHVLTTGL